MNMIIVDKHPPPSFFAVSPAIKVLNNPFMMFSFKVNIIANILINPLINVMESIPKFI